MIFSTFFQIGTACAAALFMFGVVPTLLLVKLMNKKRR